MSTELDRAAKAIAEHAGYTWSRLGDLSRDHYREAARRCIGALEPVSDEVVRIGSARAREWNFATGFTAVIRSIAGQS